MNKVLRAEPFFFWQGSPVSFNADESIAVALLRAGINELGSADDGRIKSMFCGIGQCQGCTVFVGGIGNIEACLTLCQQDLQVRPCRLLPFKSVD